jgi:hypothetical protein
MVLRKPLRHLIEVGIINSFIASLLCTPKEIYLSATALNTIPIVGIAFSLVLPFAVAFVAGVTIVVALKELFQAARS